eukprot:1615935-Prymnesium_polylepis.1
MKKQRRCQNGTGPAARSTGRCGRDVNHSQSCNLRCATSRQLVRSRGPSRRLYDQKSSSSSKTKSKLSPPLHTSSG